ncbi:hypothetical protein [Bradyrhizobium sp.]|uniref:hypothetical protein n=1 Tax=Bradyrhizobium sp. TaxID=376 RepID=UPI002733CF5F|nr:hypothetical protein [Bradyrhizobium sp.]MDP3074739.1 hypothetical protein [Bradyrhizobium sp.]
MSRKNSLTLRRGTTTAVVEGCYALTCFTLVAITYILMSPFRLAGAGIERITQGLLTKDDD